MIKCVSCGKENNDSEMMCYSCGEDLDAPAKAKAPAQEKKRKARGFKKRVEEASNSLAINEDFLIVEQQVEWLETFTDYETENRYAILNKHGEEQFFAEERSPFWARFFMSSQRPLDIEVFNNDGDMAMAIRKPFKFFVPEIQVYDENDQLVGYVKKKFWALRRTFFVCDADGREFCKIIGPLFKVWTFKIMKDNKETGRISKKWSGMGKEMFTDADTFNVQFPQNASDQEKKIFLGTTFLIDLIYFENNN